MSDRGGQTTKQTYVTRYSTDVDPRTLPDFKQRGAYRPANNPATPDHQYYNNNNNNDDVSPSRSSQSASELNSYTSDGHRLRKKYTVTTVTTVTTTTILLPNMQDAVVMPSNTTYQIEDSNNNNTNNNNNHVTYNENGQARNALLIQAAPSQSAPYVNNNNHNHSYNESSRPEMMMPPYAPQSAAATTSASTTAPYAQRNIQQYQQQQHVQAPAPQEYMATHHSHNESRALVPLPASDPTAHALARPAAVEAPGNTAQWRFVQNNTTATNQAVCYDKPPTLAELGIASYFDHNAMVDAEKDDDGEAHHGAKRRNEPGNGMRVSATSLPESSASAPRRTSQSPSVSRGTNYVKERMPRPQKPVRYVPSEEYVQGGGRANLAPYVTQETRSELEGGTYSRR